MSRKTTDFNVNKASKEKHGSKESPRTDMPIDSPRRRQSARGTNAPGDFDFPKESPSMDRPEESPRTDMPQDIRRLRSLIRGYNPPEDLSYWELWEIYNKMFPREPLSTDRPGELPSTSRPKKIPIANQSEESPRTDMPTDSPRPRGLTRGSNAPGSADFRKLYNEMFPQEPPSTSKPKETPITDRPEEQPKTSELPHKGKKKGVDFGKVYDEMFPKTSPSTDGLGESPSTSRLKETPITGRPEEQPKTSELPHKGKKKGVDFRKVYNEMFPGESPSVDGPGESSSAEGPEESPSADGPGESPRTRESTRRWFCAGISAIVLIVGLAIPIYYWGPGLLSPPDEPLPSTDSPPASDTVIVPISSLQRDGYAKGSCIQSRVLIDLGESDFAPKDENDEKLFQELATRLDQICQHLETMNIDSYFEFAETLLTSRREIVSMANKINQRAGSDRPLQTQDTVDMLFTDRALLQLKQSATRLKKMSTTLVADMTKLHRLSCSDTEDYKSLSIRHDETVGPTASLYVICRKSTAMREEFEALAERTNALIERVDALEERIRWCTNSEQALLEALQDVLQKLAPFFKGDPADST